MIRIKKALRYAIILTLLSLVVFILNLALDRNVIDLIGTFHQLNENYLIKPIIIIILWYLGLFFCLFWLAFAIQDRVEKEHGKKIPIGYFIGPLFFLILGRSIITEPYLYQTFYTTIKPFALLMDALLFFDIKWIIDAALLVIIMGSSIILLKRHAYIVIGLILIMVIPKSNPTSLPSADNAETVILIMTDSLRKDTIEQDSNLFLNQFFDKSTVIENMYTPFPASIPAMAGIFSGQYPYKYHATALSIHNPLDLSLVNSLKQQYRLSIHTDFTDDEVTNRPNFNIPFDEVHAPVIDFQSTIYANALLKNIVLMAFINGDSLRNTLLPQLYKADNANSEETINSALDYLLDHRQDKKIALISLGDTHIPFRATYPYYRSFLTDQKGDEFNWVFDYEDFTYHGESPTANENIRNLYQMSAQKLDDHIEYFVKTLEQTNLLKNTTIVIFADQGENLFDEDMDLYSHNNLDTRHVLNVPFAIYRPDKKGSVITDGNYSLHDTLGIALNPDIIKDYARSDIYIEADLDVHDPSNPLYVSRLGENVLDINDLNNITIKNDNILQQYKRRALINDDYILTYHPNNESAHALYHLPTDPLFQSDQQQKQPQIFSALREKLDEFIRDTARY